MGDKQGHPFRGNQYTDAKISNDVTASYGGQVNGTLRAQDAGGRTLAYLDWVRYGGGVSVSMVETAPEARRQGLARKLVERLLDENPGARLEWGMTTPEGTALR
jgi:GNAT superfamily N-acetyltransferase